MAGRLTWTTHLVKLLETHGILPHGAEERFLKVVNEVRAEEGAKFYP